MFDNPNPSRHAMTADELQHKRIAAEENADFLATLGNVGMLGSLTSSMYECVRRVKAPGWMLYHSLAGFAMAIVGHSLSFRERFRARRIDELIERNSTAPTEHIVADHLAIEPLQNVTHSDAWSNRVENVAAQSPCGPQK